MMQLLQLIDPFYDAASTAQRSLLWCSFYSSEIHSMMQPLQLKDSFYDAASTAQAHSIRSCCIEFVAQKFSLCKVNKHWKEAHILDN